MRIVLINGETIEIGETLTINAKVVDSDNFEALYRGIFESDSFSVIETDGKYYAFLKENVLYLESE